MDGNSRKKQVDDLKNSNPSKDPQSSTLADNSPQKEQAHRHSKIEKAIMTFQLENIVIKLPHLTSFIVHLQIDDSKLIFSPKATTEENNFIIGYNMQKIVIARINNSHSRAKARKIFISVSVFNKDKKKIAYGKIEIHPGSFYGEEKLKLRPISIDLNTIEPCPLFFFGLQLNDIPNEKPATNDENNSEIIDRDIPIPQLENFELPETLISTKKRIAHRNSDTELMTEEDKETIQQHNEEDLNQDENEDENENDNEFYVINNPDLIAIIEEEERKKQEEIKRKQEEEILRKKQEEERKKQEELKRKQEEERKKQEELKRKKEEEIRRKKEEERKKQEELKRKKEEELKRKIEKSKKKQLENLMQKSSSSNVTNTATKLKNKIKNKKNFVNCISKNSILLKNTINAIKLNIKESLPNNSETICIKYRRSFSTTPKKVTSPSLIFPLIIEKNLAFSYSYRLPTDENGNLIENAPFEPNNVTLEELDICKKYKKSAFKSINIKSKTTNEVIDYKREKQTKKVCDAILNNIECDPNLKCEMKKIVENSISNSKPGSVRRAQDLLPLIGQPRINNKNNYVYQQNNSSNTITTKNIINGDQSSPTFLSDSFINNSYNSYRNDTNRQALFLLSNDNNSTNESSIVEHNDFMIDEICAKHGDVDNDENGNFRTRYERLQRQSKIKFILSKIRRYNPQNRPQKLETHNLIFYEWKVNASSDEDDLYEYYDYD